MDIITITIIQITIIGTGVGGVVKGHVKEFPLPTHPSAGVFKYSCVLYSRNHCSMAISLLTYQKIFDEIIVNRDKKKLYILLVKYCLLTLQLCH